MADKFEPIAIKIEREDDDWLVDEPGTSQYVEAKIEREESGEENKFKCNHPNCKYSTNVRIDFKNHEAIHSNERPHKCDKCVRTFKNKSYLRIHRRKVHFKELEVERKKQKGEMFTCKELNCKYSSHFKKNLKAHDVTHSKEKPYKCDKCEQAFKRSGGLKIHLQYHSEESNYQCDECEKVYKTKGGLTSHKFTHVTEKKIKKLRCEESDCEFATFRKRSLKVHAAEVHSKEKPFKCAKCYKSFKWSFYLKNHMMLHSTETLFQCDKCDHSFKVKASLTQHKLIHRPKEDWYKCDVCDYTTSGRSNLIRHQFGHTDAKPFKCDLCELSLKNQVCLGRHKKTVHSNAEKSLKCDKCDFRTHYSHNLKEHLIKHMEPNTLKFEKCDYPNCEFSTSIKRKLRTHKREIHERLKLFKCDQCERTFTTLWPLKQHSLSHSKIKPIKCDLCELSFKSEKTFRTHKKNVHSDGEKPLKCDKCDFRTCYTQCLREHLIKHMEPNTLKFEKCDYPNCGFSTPIKRILKIHKRKIHERRESQIHERLKLFKCDQCERAFIHLGSLKRHSFSHSKIKPIKCERCRYSCATKILLKQHSNKHINEKEHKCEECGDSYDAEKDLKNHKLRHDEANRKFKCNLCNYRAFQKKSLLSHVSQRHNNKKPFKCEICDRSFNLRCRLKLHQFVHSKTKNFICHQCDYRTHCPRNLKLHQILHRVFNEKSGKKCDQCGLILRDELDSRTHQDAHRACFVPLRNIIVRHVKIELKDFVKREII